MSETAPLDPFAVCEFLDVRVYPISRLVDEQGNLVGEFFLKEKPEEFSGAVIRSGMCSAIIHNDAHTIPRQRSNLCHELAHIFLGHPIAQVVNEDGGRNRHAVMEEEAAFLGGVLLIPNEAAHYIVKSGLLGTAADTYGVSVEMLNYRIKKSGALITHIRRMNRSSKRLAAG
ncbi:MAG: ImmA/IrrE family metallo-endopeptidase [Acetobacteraceae bacterium]|nr:ImmA/IrrE family metallo-endopeptidase [Acetobacteraceae bacterium]